MLKTQSSKFVTGNAVAGPNSVLCSVTVLTDGANDATATIYDNNVVGGDVIEQITCPAAELSKTVTYAVPLFAASGISILPAGTGALVIISFAPFGEDKY